METFSLAISWPPYRGSTIAVSLFTEPGMHLRPLVRDSPVPSWSSCPGSSSSLIFADERLQECLQSHDSCSKNEFTVLPKRVLAVGKAKGDPIQLIENLNQNERPKKGKYAILSYCWGGARFPRTLYSNLDAHKNAIPSDGPDSLPSVFLEAVSLCHRFDIPFIWIDCLCIIQPDHPEMATIDFEEEAPKMADYYSNAFLTISATSSPDPTVPFLQTRRDDKYGNHVFPIHSLESGEQTMVCARLTTTWMANEKRSQVDHYGPLADRGRAWQETALSTRNLHFCRSQLWWECKTHIVPECTPDGKDERLGQAKIMRDAEDNPFLCWTKIVREYSQRTLTYEQDRFPGISGAAARIKSLMGSEKYYAGIWEGYLVQGLLWYSVLRSLTNIDRWREIKGEGSCPTAPSWSWASIHGEICYPETSVLDRFVSLMEIEHISVEVPGRSPFGRVSGGRLEVTSLVVNYEIEWTIKRNNTRGRVLCLPGVSTFEFDCALVPYRTVARRTKILRDSSQIDDSAADRMVKFRCKVPFMLMGKSGSKFYLMVLGSSNKDAGFYARLGTSSTTLSYQSLINNRATKRRVVIV